MPLCLLNRANGRMRMFAIASRVLNRTRRLSIAAFLSATALAGCDFEVTRNIAPVVLETDGAVVSRTAAADQPIVANMRLRVPATLVTDKDGRAAISLLPGALMEVEPESELQIDRVRLSKNGNRIQEAMRRQIDLTLQRGSIDVVVQFPTESSSVRVMTPNGMLAVAAPALFRLDVFAGKTRVTCARGRLRFTATNDGEIATVDGPAVREWPAGGESIPAEFDRGATNEIENLRNLERKLLGLQDRSRLTPFPWRQ